MTNEKESLFENDFYQIQMQILEKEDEIIFRRLAEHCQQYTDIKVSKAELKEAITKQRPMKPNRYYFNKYLCKCGNCCKTLDITEHDYCPQCGQKIDWSDYPVEKMFGEDE